MPTTSTFLFPILLFFTFSIGTLAHARTLTDEIRNDTDKPLEVRCQINKELGAHSITIPPSGSAKSQRDIPATLVAWSANWAGSERCKIIGEFMDIGESCMYVAKAYFGSNAEVGSPYIRWVIQDHTTCGAQLKHVMPAKAGIYGD